MKGLSIFCRWCQWWRKGVDACDVCGNPWFEHKNDLDKEDIYETRWTALRAGNDYPF